MRRMSQTPDSEVVDVHATQAELEAAFDEWLRQYQEDPESFEDYDAPDADTRTYGQNCARYLIRMLGELREDDPDAADA
jgi:hypothetical protein